MASQMRTTLDKLSARLLKTQWVVRAPIGLFRAGLGWMMGPRFVLIEHEGRKSHEPRYVVVEIIEREENVIRVASGFGVRTQWYRNLAANGVAFLSTGRSRRVPAAVRLLSEDESATCLARYAQAHPGAWEKLSGAMDAANGPGIWVPVVEFSPPEKF